MRELHQHQLYLQINSNILKFYYFQDILPVTKHLRPQFYSKKDQELR